MVEKAFWKGKRVLITGHTGFKGSWLSMVLNRLGAEVSGYSLLPPTEPNLFTLCNIGSLVDSTIADISDVGELSAKIESAKPEIIFHMAAQSLVRLSYTDPLITYKTNVMGTVNLFEAVRLSGSVSKRVIVNITTDKCYENKEWIWPYRENEPLGGYDPYSNSKACSELVTSAYRNSFFNPSDFSNHKTAVGSARAGNVIGGGDWATDRLIPDIIRSVLVNKKILIRNPESIRPWQHVLDPLLGYISLARQLYDDPVKFSGAWNFGPSESDARSVSWIVDQFCSKWPGGATFEVDRAQQPHEAGILKLDSSKARSLLGWNPVWNLEKSIESIIEFYKVYRDNGSIPEICNTQIDRYLSNIK